MTRYYRPRHWVVDKRRNPHGLDWRTTACGLHSSGTNFCTTDDPTQVSCERCSKRVAKELPVAEATAVRGLARALRGLVVASERRAAEEAKAERVEAAFIALRAAADHRAYDATAIERLKQAARDFVQAERGFI